MYLELIKSKVENKLIADNIVHLGYSGSKIYGLENENSDIDLWGYFILPESYNNPDFILGFDDLKPIEQIEFNFEHNGKEVDVRLFNLPYMFKLLYNGNPTVLDMVFSIKDYTIYSDTKSGSNAIWEKRRLFVFDELIHKYLGFMRNHMKYIDNDRYQSGKRKILYEKYGYDVKSASHLFRSMTACKNLILKNDYQTDEAKHHCIPIKEGYYSKEHFMKRFRLFEKSVPLFWESKKRDSESIRTLLELLLKDYYG